MDYTNWGIKRQRRFLFLLPSLLLDNATTYHSADFAGAMRIPSDLHHVGFDTLDGSIATFVSHHPTDLGKNPSNWENGCGKYNRIYVQENNGIVN
jgi:hypothetical protein